jgi:hypothetical protein
MRRCVSCGLCICLLCVASSAWPSDCCPGLGDLAQPCDYVVDLTDFAHFASTFGSSQGDVTYDPCADFDDDGVIDLTDFVAFAQVYGQNYIPPADDCASPIPVSIPYDLPYVDVYTTCGLGNRYDETCLGYYDNGEDVIYELTVEWHMAIYVVLDPRGTTWTGMAISETCPAEATCLAMSTSPSGSPHDTDPVYLSPGTYYLMIDTWPVPDCIPEYELMIGELMP